MITSEQMSKLYKEIANGDNDAEMFLRLWDKYCHGIDDIVDKDDKAIMPADIVERFANGVFMMNCDFYKKHAQYLVLIVLLIANDYVDSNETEVILPNKDADFDVKDFLRSTGTNMLLAVALITGGYVHMRKFSHLVKQYSYVTHHDSEGNPK